MQSFPWRELGVDIVLDCTGVYSFREHGEAHIAVEAKRMPFSYPGDNDLDVAAAYDANQDQLRAGHRIIFSASYTTNCITLIVKLLNNVYGIGSDTVTTAHSAMHDRQVVDVYHPGPRRTRATNQLIIPVDTKLTTGIIRSFPQFDDRLEAIAIRVPTINVTAADLSAMVKEPAKVSEVNLLLQKTT